MIDVPRYVFTQDAFTVTTGLGPVSSTDEYDLLMLRNPSGSGKKILITHFAFGVDSTSTRSIIRIYSDPTVTSDGTALSIVNTYITSSPKASVAEAFQDPVISSRGQSLNTVIRHANSDSRGLNRFYWLDPGHVALLTCHNSNANADTFADVYWLEI